VKRNLQRSAKARNANQYHALKIQVDRPGLLAHTYAGHDNQPPDKAGTIRSSLSSGFRAKKGGTNVLLFVPGGQ
jgi:hypothetical protein